LPDNHPVFDELASKLGMLRHEDAYSISRIYNIVTGLRLLLKGFSLEAFSDLTDEEQITNLHMVAEMVEREDGPARELVRRLREQAEQGVLACGLAWLKVHRVRAVQWVAKVPP
jgi:hypothetical protein